MSLNPKCLERGTSISLPYEFLALCAWGLGQHSPCRDEAAAWMTKVLFPAEARDFLS